MEERIKTLVNSSIREKVFPGCVVGVVRENGERLVLPFGRFTYDKVSPVVKEDSIFDVASITKSIPTSCLALKLIDEGKLSLNDKLTKYVSEFRNSDREKVLIKHLLTQTLDFGYRLFSYKDKTPGEIFDTIFTSEFKSPPGVKHVYTNTTSILLGLVVEKIYGKPLDVAADEIFFRLLGMRRTTFNSEKFPKEEIVPTEEDPWRGRVIQGEVNDESAFILSKEKPVGSAGLFSTAPDLLTFTEMLLKNGVYKNKKYLSEKVIQMIFNNCLGWEKRKPYYMGSNCSEQRIGKTGFTGCSIVIDKIKEAAIVILSNYHFPKRKSNFTHLNKIRAMISEAVLV